MGRGGPIFQFNFFSSDLQESFVGTFRSLFLYSLSIMNKTDCCHSLRDGEMRKKMFQNLQKQTKNERLN